MTIPSRGGPPGSSELAASPSEAPPVIVELLRVSVLFLLPLAVSVVVRLVRHRSFSRARHYIFFQHRSVRGAPGAWIRGRIRSHRLCCCAVARDDLAMTGCD